MTLQLTIDGRETPLYVPTGDQLGMFEPDTFPLSTFPGEQPDALDTLPLYESMRAPHRVRRSR